MSTPTPSHDEPQLQQQHDRAASVPRSPPPTSQHDAEDFEGSSSLVDSSSPQNNNDTSFSSTMDDSSEKHPRARRKRTGAHDKLILEEYYQKDKKPDKSMRLKLVERVSLTEKEVQVWFQNRRQNDRRKSRPLTQQEIADLQCHGIRPLNVDDGSAQSWSVLKVTQPPMSVSDPIQSPSSSPSQTTCPATDPADANGHSRSFSEAAVTNSQPEWSSPHESQNHSHASSFPGVGYLANRRRETGSFSTPSQVSLARSNSFTADGFPIATPKDISPSFDASQNSTPQSQMRLSCSIDGKAELLTGNDAPSSSLPEPQPQSSPFSFTPPARELRRTQSAFTPDLPQKDRPTSLSHILNPMPSTSSGRRSHDVEAWMSCASSQTQKRDQLSTFAEDSLSGSATANISLLRSASNSSLSGQASRQAARGSILQPSSGSKRNAPLPHPASVRRGQPHLAKRAKLSRANSSVACLGGKDECATPPGAELFKDNDSNKENWSPRSPAPGFPWSDEAEEEGSDRSQQRRRPLPSGPTGRNGAASRGSPSLLSTRAQTAPAARRARGRDRHVEIFVDEDEKEPAREDNEVETFMNGGVSPRKQGEMEVVAGLLSLSKGAWIHTQ